MIVSTAQVRAGAPDLPYTLASANVTVADGTSSYVGCQAYRNTAVSDFYTRPDGSSYTLAKGAGTPTGPINVCVASTAGQQAVKFVSKVMTGGSCSTANYDGTPWTVCTYGIQDLFKTVAKTENKNSETGAVVSTSCQVVSGTDIYLNSYGSCSAGTGGSNCPAPQTVLSEPLISCPF